MTPTITGKDIVTALRTFLVAVLPPGVDAIIAQQNRVPEPKEVDFVVMTELRRIRIETNIDSAVDTKFSASIAGDLLDVTTIDIGSIEIGATVFGTGVMAGTTITALAGGTGGVGAYTVTPSQSVAAGVMSAGRMQVEQRVQITYQLDFHGPQSADCAQVVSTLMRDAYGVELFESQTPAVAVPLFADDPAQRPFLNDQQQVETRWVVEAMLQSNPVVLVPTQYADAVDLDVVSVDAAFPP